jgi:hypothetical protein
LLQRRRKNSGGELPESDSPQNAVQVKKIFPYEVRKKRALGRARPTNGSDRGFARSNLIRYILQHIAQNQSFRWTFQRRIE